MPNRHLVLVPLPRGRDGLLGRLSVLLVPHLEQQGHLADYQFDWARWPAAVLGAGPPPLGSPIEPLTFDVWINGRQTHQNLGHLSAQWVSDPPRLDAWRALFGLDGGQPGIRVDAYRALDQTEAPLAPMYDGVRVATGAEALRTRLAAGFPERPPTRDELGRLDELTTLLAADHVRHFDDHAAPLEGNTDPEDDPGLDDYDFHTAFSFLQAHPVLMRVLGLVVDLEIGLPDERIHTVGVTSNYQDLFGNLGGRGLEISGRIPTTLGFWPEVEGAQEFWAEIGDESHHATTFDIPATFTGLQRFGEEIDDRSNERADEQAEIPAGDSVGVQLVRPGDRLENELKGVFERRVELWQQIEARLHEPNMGPIAFEGRDVVIGVRYDIWDDTAERWFSLWDRQPVRNVARFPSTFPELQIDVPDDESWMTVTAFTEAGRDLALPEPDDKADPLPPMIDETPIRVSPIVFTWRGWSLAADPPGKAISLVNGAEARVPSEPGEDSPLQVILEYEVPDGVLPRLRYGRRYKVRARVVDYAGNSQALDTQMPRDDALETRLVAFGRETPIPAPLPVRRRQARPVPGWGDTTTVVVLRSELGQRPEEIEPAGRLFLPANTAVDRCILHGRPAPDGLFTDETVFADVVARDRAAVDEILVQDPVTDEVYAAGDEWRPELPYLVDAPAVGVAFHGLPGADETVIAPFLGDWPALSAVGLEVRAGTPKVEVSSVRDDAAVVCFTPQGMTRTVEVSCTIDEAMVPHFAAVARASSEDRRTLEQLAKRGRMWMVSARRDLTVVHAVRLPLLVPALGSVSATRPEIGDRRASLSGPLLIDVKSTDRVDVRARWTDPVDRGPDGVELVTTARLLFAQREDYDERQQVPISPEQVDLGDTRRHDATLTLEAFSRYSRYFAERATVQPTSGGWISFHDGPVAEGNIEVSTEGRHLVIGRDVEVDVHEARLRVVDRDLLGAPIDVDFVPLPISRRSTESGDGTGTWEVTIPNSAIPAVVPVRDVVPAFARSTSFEDDTFRIEHRAQVIRVWIDRPWFTTGVGELLGVVLDGARADESLHTRVARDPISPATPSIDPLTVGSFPRASMTHLDVDGSGLDVAGHPVLFDQRRQQWFADVEITGTLGYRAFVQLSLGRFQPESIPGAHLGETVVTDPIRLGPSRTVTLRRDRHGAVVTVEGLAPRNRITAQWQRRDPAVDDDDLGWLHEGEPVELIDDRNDRRTTLPLPGSAGDFRLLVVDSELFERRDATGVTTDVVTTYVETVAIPSTWRTPPPVEDLAATAGDSRIDLAWQAVPDVDGVDTTYVVEHRRAGGSDALVQEGIVGTTTTIDRLDNGTTYELRVAARYGEVQGPWSETVEATPVAPPPSDPPAQVTGLTADGGDRRIHLGWDVPAGVPAGYDIEIAPGDRGRANWEPATLDRPIESGDDTASATVTGLADGTPLVNGDPYRLRVRARNDAGTGDWSDTVTATPEGPPPPPPPGQVTGVLATGADRQIGLVWDVPAGDPTGYDIEIAPGDRGRANWEPATLDRPIESGDDTASATITGLADGTPLVNGDPYRVRLRARNDGGDGPWSDTITATPQGPPPASVPDRVDDLAGEPAGEGEVQLTWSAPDDGGVAITHYRIQQAPGQGRAVWVDRAEVEPPEGDGVEVILDDLEPGERYRFRVAAVNEVGTGEWSQAERVTAG